MLFTLAVILFAVSWFLWMLKHKSKGTVPPLPPGPRGLPIVGNLLSLDPELHTYFNTLAQTYDPILTIRFGSKVGVVVTLPTIAS